MRVSIIGDPHCGFAWGEERGKDSLAALEEAVQQSRDADLIILAGDLFDSRLPKPEVFAQVAKILAQAQTFPIKARLLDSRAKDVSQLALRGVPVIALHGNHDRRSKHLINPVQALEHAGLLIHLHGGSLLFDCGGTRVGIHGMSNVPERYAKEVLHAWNPKPFPGALNILLLHQSIDPYIYSPLDPPSLKLEDLPDAFELILNGHLHWHDKRGLRGNLFLNTGSISPTAVHKYESEQTKCFWTWNGGQPEAFPLASQRRIFQGEFEYTDNIKNEITTHLEQIAEMKLGQKPLVIVSVKGTLPAGAAPPSFGDLQAGFADRLILHVTKSMGSADFETNVELLRALRENRLSPEESGLRLLMENLRQAGCMIKADEIFELLVDGNVDAIFDDLAGRQAQLTGRSGLQ